MAFRAVRRLERTTLEELRCNGLPPAAGDQDDADVMIAEAIAAGKLRRILTSMFAFDPITKKPLAAKATTRCRHRINPQLGGPGAIGILFLSPGETPIWSPWIFALSFRNNFNQDASKASRALRPISSFPSDM
ncbi:MAG: hypothetical protein R3E51_15380 [Rhizobiaceae bacterium]